MRGKLLAAAMLLGFGLSVWSGAAEAGDMTAPLPMLQMNPLLMRYMGFTAGDAFQKAGQRHRVSIQEHYASIYLTDHINSVTANYPSRYLVDMDLSATVVTLRTSVGRLGLHLDLPVLLAYGGWMDGLINGFHQAFGYPNADRMYRPSNSYGYRLTGVWNSRPGLELGNISAGLSYPLLRSAHHALAVRAAAKAPTASEQRGWGSGTWDAGIGLVDSVRIRSWFAHVEGWYFRPFGSDYVPFLKNRPYARGSLAVGVTGHFFRPLSNRRFSFILQGQGGMTPYRGSSISSVASWKPEGPLLIAVQNPWLVAGGLRWQDSHARDWLFSITENITQHSSQDISFDIGCSFL